VQARARCKRADDAAVVAAHGTLPTAYSAPMARWSKLLRRANTARLATHLLALWKLLRHAETPRAAKIVALLVLAYALSPIDLIPDFIPLLGLLDDVILLPLGIALAVKLTPRHLWLARVAEAEQGAEKLPRMLWGAAIVGGVWLLAIALIAWWLLSLGVD
jgi:uncharacterized membrane protein YkvA (DUF1232 family)